MTVTPANGQQYTLEDGTPIEGLRPPATPEELRLYLLEVRAMKAFHRELEELTKEHRRQWVAYHGDQQIGLGRTKRELHQECLRRGIPAGEVLIRWIEGEMPGVVVDPFGLDKE